ncbi:MAG: hypothetical protein ACPG8A_02945 [Psychrobium sp.]
MKHLKKIHRAPVRVSRIQGRRMRNNFRRTMIDLKIALAQEKEETVEMLQIYGKGIKGQAEKQDLKVAHAQFFDILKGLGLGVFAILPFAPITIPVIIKLAKAVGVDVLPSSFSQKDK